MSKTWETKRRIINLLSKKQMTLSDISSELDMAPSTVSEHIDNLKRIGAISEVDNPYIKKWKYYRANPEFDINRFIRGEPMTNRIPIAIGIIVAIAIVVAVGILFAAHQSANGNLVLSLTDPPFVPSGTQSLIISYSSVRVHTVGNGNTSEWINATGSGSVDLLTLINDSQIIATANVPANVSVNQIAFAISSAHIDINGTTYNVSVPNNMLVVPVSTNGTINGKANILIDLSPTVAAIYSGNTTDFVLVPSVKAIVIYGNRTSVIRVGARTSLTGNEKAEIIAASKNVVIGNVAIATQGDNTTGISVTVNNNGNNSITIKHILVFGEFNASVYPLLPTVVSVTHVNIHAGVPEVSDNIVVSGRVSGNSNNMIGSELNSSSNMNASASSNSTLGINNITASQNGNVRSSTIASGNYNSSSSGGGYANSTNTNNMLLGLGIDVRSYRNIHIFVSGNAQVSSQDKGEITTLANIGISVSRARGIYFIVNSNGTLTLPSSAYQLNSQASTGYVIQPGSSATFTFNGPISAAHGRVIANVVSGDNYRVVVQGEPYILVIANVTATTT